MKINKSSVSPPPPLPSIPPQPSNTPFTQSNTSNPAGNIALLPLRTGTRGPSTTLPALTPPETPLTIDPSHPSYDPIDEALSLFRANTLFRNFEIHGPADRLLIYTTLFTSALLTAVKPSMTRREADKAMMNLALDTNFAVPGDAGFPLNQAFEAPTGHGEMESLRAYLGQVRQETAARLGERLFSEGERPSKVCFLPVFRCVCTKSRRRRRWGFVNGLRWLMGGRDIGRMCRMC